MTATLQKAVHLVSRAVEEDKNHNYEEALRLYEHALEYFLYTAKYENVSDKSREKIKAKTALYVVRADKIKQYLENKGEYEKLIEDSDDDILLPRRCCAIM